MTHSILLMLPLVLVGIAVILLVHYLKKKNDSKTGVKEEASHQKEASSTEDNMALGMSLGVSFGAAIGSIFTNQWGPNAITYGICFGMLAGMLIGMLIKK